MDLMNVKENASQIAQAINRIVGVDVVIVDRNLNRVTDTTRYDRESITIRKDSIVGRIIESGRSLAIDDKKVFRSCIECSDYSVCRMQSLIGVPILLNGQAIGAIALAIPPSHMQRLFNNLSHTIDFLEKMAEMLAGKLLTQQDYEELSRTKRQQELLMDVIEDGIVLVDEVGRIVYYNETFSSMFLGGDNARDMNMLDLISHPQIEAFLTKKWPLRNKLIYCETRRGKFDGYITVAPFETNDSYYGAVFLFRRISDADAACSDTRRIRYHMSDIVTESRDTTRMKRAALAAAKTSDALLLEGPVGMRLKEMAYAIHSDSARSKGNFLLVDCKKSLLQELEEELFGTSDNEGCSKIRLAHKGTICLHSVDCLPQYLQRRLCDYLVRGTVVISYGEMVSDARLIMTTSENLEFYVDEGMFDKTLYERVRANRIFVPAISGGHSEDITEWIHVYLSFFTKQYNTGPLTLEPQVEKAICSMDWPQDTARLRNFVEYLVKTSRNHTISMSQIPPRMLRTSEETAGPKSIDALLEGQIRGLMKQGNNYREIAESLHISRATLYRKIKKYQINER